MPSAFEGGAQVEAARPPRHPQGAEAPPQPAGGAPSVRAGRFKRATSAPSAAAKTDDASMAPRPPPPRGGGGRARSGGAQRSPPSKVVMIPAGGLDDDDEMMSPDRAAAARERLRRARMDAEAEEPSAAEPPAYNRKPRALDFDRRDPYQDDLPLYGAENDTASTSSPDTASTGGRFSEHDVYDPTSRPSSRSTDYTVREGPSAGAGAGAGDLFDDEDFLLGPLLNREKVVKMPSEWGDTSDVVVEKKAPPKKKNKNPPAAPKDANWTAGPLGPGQSAPRPDGFFGVAPAVEEAAPENPAPPLTESPPVVRRMNMHVDAAPAPVPPPAQGDYFYASASQAPQPPAAAPSAPTMGATWGMDDDADDRVPSANAAPPASKPEPAMVEPAMEGEAPRKKKPAPKKKALQQRPKTSVAAPVTRNTPSPPRAEESEARGHDQAAGVVISPRLKSLDAAAPPSPRGSIHVSPRSADDGAGVFEDPYGDIDVAGPAIVEDGRAESTVPAEEESFNTQDTQESQSDCLEPQKEDDDCNSLDGAVGLRAPGDSCDESSVVPTDDAETDTDTVAETVTTMTTDASDEPVKKKKSLGYYGSLDKWHMHYQRTSTTPWMEKWNQKNAAISKRMAEKWNKGRPSSAKC